MASKAASNSAQESAATTFGGLERQLAAARAEWIAADADFLASACRRMTPTARKHAASPDEFDSRKQVCGILAGERKKASDLETSAGDAQDGDAFEKIQTDFESVRSQLDQLIATFPTSGFAESNFGNAAATEFRAKHEAEATKAADIATKAVDVARRASADALAQARQSQHEIDKTRAQEADSNYTKASLALKQMGDLTEASAVIGAAGSVLTAVDWVLGSSQTATNPDGNPVGKIVESVPAAVPVATAPPVVTGQTMSNGDNSVVVSNSNSGAAEAVGRYYGFWNSKQYKSMYSMLSTSYQSAHPYSDWLSSHSGTEAISAQTSNGAEPGAVRVLIHSTDRNSDGSVSQYAYAGVWHLTYSNSQWRLDAVSLKQL